MNKINRKVEYALMALKLMSLRGAQEVTSAKEVSDNLHAPFEVMARVLQQLVQGGLLKSIHGIHGGYVIDRDLSEVSFGDLQEIILGPVEIAKCFVETCELSPSCNIVTPVSYLNDKLKEFYATVTVQELIKQAPSKKTPRVAPKRAESLE